MSLDDVIGHDRAIEQLRRAIEAGRTHHALLFQGPDGVGKRTLARAVATELLAGGADDPEATRQRVAHHAHPDLLVVRRINRKIERDAPIGDLDDEQEREIASDKNLSTRIRVFQIRELIEHAGFAPREADCRVFLIDPAERMNAAAQNALLKTLEEPPGRTYLMLLAVRPHLLLPTVRSRCYAVRLGPLPARELARELERQGMDAEQAHLRASLAGGRVGRALSLDVEAVRERRLELVQALEALARSPRALARLGEMTSALGPGTETELLEGLEMLEEALRDAARLACGLETDAGLDPERAARLEAVAAALGPERAAALVRSIERLKSDLRFNVNRTLVAEAVLTAVAGGPLP